jgi:hypothetical protein
MARRLPTLAALWMSLVIAICAPAEEPFRYPEAKYGRGELKYIENIPVLTIGGSPQEIGQQLGTLALKPATGLTAYVDEFITQQGWQSVYKLVLKTGNVLVPRFPRNHIAELEAAATASGWPRDMLVFGNTIVDLRRVIGCSAMIVETERSATGGPLLGRNLDWPSVARLHEYTMLIVYRPDGKRAFASITFPGVLGCTSGMNDAGLVVAMLDAFDSRDGAPSLNPLGIPTLLMLRRILEECASIEEAATLLRSIDRASSLNIAICDKRRGAVLEVTTKNVVMRPSESGVCLCTNHFRSRELATSKECWRYDRLLGSLGSKSYSVPDIAERLHAVNQGPLTLQTMVFDPTSLELHLAFGEGPASRLPMSRVNLAELFRLDRSP